MDKGRLLLLLLLVGGVIAVAIVSELDPVDSTSRANIEESAIREDTGPPLARTSEEEHRQLEAGVPERGQETTPASEAGPVTPDTAPDGSAAEVALPEESPIVPIYGPAVQRSGAVATFALADAKDQPLYGQSVEVELWRRVGTRWTQEEVWYDPTTRTIRCDGLSGLGLEPGEYELEASTPHYSCLRHSFRISKGEQLEGKLQLPCWRRVICFEFQQRGGLPHAWIHKAPSVSTTSAGLEEIERPQSPEKVLRDPPPRPGSDIGLGGRGGRGGFAYRRARGGPDTFLTATDEGKYYVPVIAGADNEVTFSFSGPWADATLEYADTFTGPEWDCYEVTLDVAPDFAEQTAEWEKRGTGDPGNRSALNWLERLLNPPALDDVKSLARPRIVLALDAPAGVVPMYDLKGSESEPTILSRVMPMRDGWYYMDGQPGWILCFAMRVDGQICTETESITFPADQTISLQRIERKLELKVVPSPIWQLTPTVDSWAAWRGLYLGDYEPFTVEFSRDSYLVSPLLEKCLREAGLDAISTHSWRLAPAAARVYELGEWHGEWETRIAHVRFETTTVGATLDQLTAGMLTPPKVEGFFARAIGPSLEGLPWVEASVISYEEDARALRLRELETALAVEGKRPRLGWEFGIHYYNGKTDFSEEGIDPAEMENHLGADFIKAISDRADLSYYTNYGAWYNTRRKLHSDSLGYINGLGWSLTPGKLYVIYLWSNSRDDLRPDARVVFRAVEGMTDIGAIALPTYSS